MSPGLVFDQVVVQAGARRLLDGVSLAVAPGELVAVVGPNGAGKSTLMRTALGMLHPASGSVLLDGEPIQRLSGRQRAARAAWLPQRGEVHEPIDVLDFVCSGRFRFDEGIAHARSAARRCLAQAGAERFEGRDLTTLSGGEQQRVAVAAMLAQEAPLLLLDEPAAHLDPRQQIELHQLLGALWREGHGVLCNTHDVNLLAYVIGETERRPVRVVGLREGRIAFTCGYDSPQLPDHLGALFDVRMEVVQRGVRRFFLGEPERAP